MSSGVGASMKTQRQLTSVRRLWLIVWVAASLIPMLPYAWPLLNQALADTPYAYLVWIPPLALAWACTVLWNTPRYPDDAELNGILGVVAAVTAGGLLIGGLHQWAHIFVADSAGLIIWPVWALGMAWLIFGVGVTRRLLKPLVYMLLAWPPIYTEIVNLTNPLLYAVANRVTTLEATVVPWLKNSSTYGNYLVLHGSNWLVVTVSSACSGADSFLAMVILLPVILVAFRGNWWKKFILIIVGSVLALLLNLVRLAILLAAAHWLPPTVTFGILHETLGGVLFVVILIALGTLARWLHMNMVGTRPAPAARDDGGFLAVPGWRRGALAVALTALLTVGLFPLYTWANGSLRAPIAVSTDNLAQLMPQMAGYHRTLLGQYNEASVLGPGSKGTAFAYTSKSGGYVTAELWWTYNLNSLVAYGVNQCLLFHGNSIVGQNTFPVANGITGNGFAILLPPAQVGGKQSFYEDVNYIYAVDYNGRKAYIRAEFAVPVAYGVTPKSALVQDVASKLPALWGQETKSAVIPSTSPETARTLRSFHDFVQVFSSRTLDHASQTASA